MNRLANEPSPYLQQHANNPVDWYPWSDEALEKARSENKPILLSIGYSSCHWCHVMAHESFENDTIAAKMNQYFINIKLDREERPDIDQVYMDAVQTMGLRGGWPLNVFLTPDQKPFYGGTYFPPDQWSRLLDGIHQAYEHNYDKLYESATQFAEGLQMSEAAKYGLGQDQVVLKKEDFDSAFSTLASKFDPEWGGIRKAPKFPMPALWEFLAHYHHLSGHASEALAHFTFTLDKMAYGGIYDHIGGGFARYSVDSEWHVPHFEKMLYDNGQMLSLYATGYKLTHKQAYREVLLGTASWLKREMMDTTGGFYSALDADSEGEEGKFYVWTFEEVRELAGEDFSLIAEYYNITRDGNWEAGKNILRKLTGDEQLASELGLDPDRLKARIKAFNEKALEARAQRIRPGLDHKVISGWNGLALTGLCQAYQATGDRLFTELAQKNAAFIKNELISGQTLKRIHGLPTGGYLEDYAAVIQAFITYYESFFDESYLLLANDLAGVVMEDFFDAEEGFFYYTGTKAESLIARKKEIFDNVIPSSNSIMAHNLYRLGTLLDNDSFKSRSVKMVASVNKLVKQEPEFLANWALTSMMIADATEEIVLVGDEAEAMAATINRHYLPNKVILASAGASTLPLFEHKSALQDKTTIYVCYNKSCKRPVFSVEETMQLVQATNNPR